jgi:hypothetical protein
MASVVSICRKTFYELLKVSFGTIYRVCNLAYYQIEEVPKSHRAIEQKLRGRRISHGVSTEINQPQNWSREHVT